MNIAKIANSTAFQQRFIRDLAALVAIPSVSTLPKHEPNIRAAGDWLMHQLTEMGMANVRRLDSPRPPSVFAEWIVDDTAPTVLIYGHYDVQPAEPLDLWDSPPFELTEKGDRVYGRGATDDKAGVVGTFTVLRTLKENGILPQVNIKLFFEGEEEIGSPNVSNIVSENRELLACDLVVSVDGAQPSIEQPALMLGLRGGFSATLHVKGPARDVHSGLYGGLIRNPVDALCELMASMRSPDGTILIEGFYDQVAELSASEREQINAVPFSEAEVLGNSGSPALFGEPGYTPLERNWIRPTLEITGIWGGHNETSPKTIIPAEAHANIVARLVADQDPDETVQLVAKHVETHAPTGVEAWLEQGPVRAQAYAMSASHPANAILSRILKEVFGRDPHHTRVGGSIPVVPLFQQLLGAPTIMCPFGIYECNLHAPNEFNEKIMLQRGSEILFRLLKELGAMKTE
jgi:acetylornithine deacetylase/succinyl-diaminopimelate desuccinylase-like protein